MEGIHKKTVFELIITKEWIDGKGWHYIPLTANENVEESYSLEEALAIIAASSEITNLFTKRLFAKAMQNKYEKKSLSKE